MEKKLTRRRRALRARCKMKELGVTRLCVNKTSQHIYAQIIVHDRVGDKVIAAASSLDKELKATGALAGNIKGAKAVGDMIAKRALAQGITKVAFDRSGFKYHGCVAALANAARESGLQF